MVENTKLSKENVEETLKNIKKSLVLTFLNLSILVFINR